MNDSMTDTFKRVVVNNTSVKILSFFITTADNKYLYPNYKLLSQYFLGMHQNEKSCPKLKRNKIKHWAEGRIPNTVFLISSPM